MADKTKTNSAKAASAGNRSKADPGKKTSKSPKRTSSSKAKSGAASGRKGLVAKTAETVAQVMAAAASGAVKGAAAAGTEILSNAVHDGKGNAQPSAKTKGTVSGSVKKAGVKETSKRSK